MPKLKTRKSFAKRVKRTGRGKFLRWKAGKSHILTKKGRKRKRALRHRTLVSDVDTAIAKRLLPYG